MFATPQTQPQPTFGLGQQMITIDDKQFPQFHGDQLKQMIDFVNQFQWDINLQNLITVIRNEQERSIEIMEKICSVESKEQNMDTKAQKEQAEYIKERSAKIKKRNHQLLIKMLNLRDKMVNSMYMYKTRSPARELEISHINQKIRDLKCQISFKYNKLRGLRLNKEVTEELSSKPKLQSPMTKIPLLQLKKGAEVLEKETLRLQKEFELLQKYIHGEQIL